MIKTLKELSDLIDIEQEHPSIDRASKRITLSLAEAEDIAGLPGFTKPFLSGEEIGSFRTYSIFVK